MAEQKFGPVPAEVKQAIMKLAALPDVERVMQRLLTASSLAEFVGNQ
jgi:hypothetical protein